MQFESECDSTDRPMHTFVPIELLSRFSFIARLHKTHSKAPWQHYNTQVWMILTVRTSCHLAGKKEPQRMDGFTMQSKGGIKKFFSDIIIKD